MSKVYIVAAKRTPIGKFLGGLSNLEAADMAAEVIKNILEETKINPANIDEVICGNILMAGKKTRYCTSGCNKSGYPC